MNSFLFQLYRIAVPKPLRTRILMNSLRRNIPLYFSSLPQGAASDEERSVAEYIMLNGASIFPYSFQHNYSPDKVEVCYDSSNSMRYVLQEGKRLYFRKNWSEKRIKRAYADLAREQDPESPHRYLNGNFDLGENDVVADIGAAEGNFSLSVVERVKKIYLFEYNSQWAEALRATFSPWKEKVVIVNKYLSSTDDEKNVTFDTFFSENSDITFLKIDVDGSEASVLRGGKETLASAIPLKIALCTYHRQDDEKEFTALLKGYGFSVSPSDGYMLNYYDKKLKAPWLRRGLVRAVR